MSKKTKRLEKENLTLTRKHDQTNRNILEMAEERTRDKDDLERLRKQETQMRNIIKSMQEQGRGLPVADEEGTESEYDEEYEDEDDEDEGEYEDEIDDDVEIDPVELERVMKLEKEMREKERLKLVKGKMPEGGVDGRPVFGPERPPELMQKFDTKVGGGGEGSGGGGGLVNGVGAKH